MLLLPAKRAEKLLRDPQATSIANAVLSSRGRHTSKLARYLSLPKNPSVEEMASFGKMPKAH